MFLSKGRAFPTGTPKQRWKGVCWTNIPVYFSGWRKKFYSIDTRPAACQVDPSVRLDFSRRTTFWLLWLKRSLCYYNCTLLLGMFQLISLVFTINLWPNLLSKFWKFLNLFKYAHTSKISGSPNLWLFILQLRWLFNAGIFCDFSLPKIWKTYLGPMVAETGSWLILYHCTIVCLSLSVTSTLV